MPDFEEVSIADLSYAKKQLLQASNRLAQLKNQYYMGEEDMSPSQISIDDLNDIMLGISPVVAISDCQVCVELSAKAMCKTVGVNPPESHDLEFENDRIEGLFSRIPDEFRSSNKIPRVIFLVQFWERFYTLAKYGVPEKNLASHDFMKPRDARRAIQDAEYCRAVGLELHNYVLSEKGIGIEDLDFNYPPEILDRFEAE